MKTIPTMPDDQKRWLEALLDRLRDTLPGGNYDLTAVERELLLWEIDRLRYDLGRVIETLKTEQAGP